MSVKDIIFHKQRLKQQQQQEPLGGGDDNEEGDDDDDSYDDVDPGPSIAPPRPTRKRKRNQTTVDKQKKKVAEAKRTKAATDISIRKCPHCVREGYYTTDEHHSRSTSNKCEYAKRLRAQKVKDREEVEEARTVCGEPPAPIQGTDIVTRKIGQKSLLHLEPARRGNLTGGINNMVGYIRNVVIKAHLFMTYYVYDT
ncbi:hypothetical protein BC941DRAFT_456901 [Chlamydoabsidia padenii]|nr:hypothetical protein BC941DRAFT_456901 [Chlamydoabsidia padenii]